MFQFTNDTTDNVDQVNLCDVESIRIFKGDKDFVLFMKNGDIIQGTRYLRNSPHRIFMEYFKTLVSDSNIIYKFNEITDGRKSFKLTLGRR